MSNRPPIKASRDAATKALITAHKAEYEDLVKAELAAAGWEQKSETVTRWRQA
jgi:hypothetical protein